MEDLEIAKASPLRETRTEQITFHPGDPGYDEAPPSFDEMAYLGDFEWVNLESGKP